MKRQPIVLRDLHGLTPPRRGRFDRFVYGVVTGFLVGATLFGFGLIRAQEAEEIPRYTPSARGTRPAVVRWRPLLEQYDWPVAVALRVVDCESEGREWVPNQQGSGALGLFQTMPSWRGLAYALTGSSDLSDPVVNVAVAYYLWADSGGSFGWYDAHGRPRGHWAASIGCWGW